MKQISNISPDTGNSTGNEIAPDGREHPTLPQEHRRYREDFNE
ncbi:MAG: hypothetical protein ACXVZU_05480 [Methanobacteriaceae archaeon]